MKPSRLGTFCLSLVYACLVLLGFASESQAALSLLELGPILAQATISQAASSEVLLYVHTDHLGIPVMMMDEQGQTVWEADMEPFGQATITAQPGVTLNLRFPGQYYDSETGLHYNYFRDYDPTIARYVEPDPIGIQEGTNRLYLYVENNPISFVDSFGLKLCRTLLPGLGECYLDEKVFPRIRDWLALNRTAGIGVQFTSAFRTTAAQRRLANDPAATTPAPASSSLHEAGFAVDISWRRLTSGEQRTVRENAARVGLSWGGRFRPPDPVHFYHEVPGGKKERKSKICQAQKDFEKGEIPECE